MSLAEKTNGGSIRLALTLGILLSFVAASFLARAAYRYLTALNTEAPWEHGLTDAAYVAFLRIAFVVAAVIFYIVIRQIRGRLAKAP